MAGAKGKASTKKSTSRKTAAPERGVWREVVGILLFFTGVILIYLLATGPREGWGAKAVWFCRALAGGLSYIVGIAFCWIGAIVAFSGRERSVSFRRVLLIIILAVLVMTLVHLFSAADIMRGASLYDYTTFLERSRDYHTGGAGLIGAILCWPLYRNLTEAGAAITIVALMLVNLILQRKISLRKIGTRAQERFEDFRQHHTERATQRMVERENRQREKAAVIPNVAPRPDEENDPFIKYLGDEAPSRKRKREQRIEKIDPDQPFPGEPKVKPIPPNDLIDDIPDFLSGRRKSQIKAEKINIAEPKTLGQVMNEALYPMPDGSEVAEAPPNGEIVSRKINIQTTDDDIDRFMSSGDIVALINEQTKDVHAKGSEHDDEDEDIAPIASPERGSGAAKGRDGGVAKSMPPIAKPAPPIAKPAVSERPGTPHPSKPSALTPSPQGEGNQPAIKPAGGVAKPASELPIYVYPPVDLLEASKTARIQNQSERDLEKGKKLIETLASFNISARMTGVAHGPTVTRFELAPAPGVKVSRITALADDIALNLAAVSVRIEAPIPGKSAVGVEVPNDVIEVVPLRDVLESPECRKATSRLAVALGRDNAGRYVIADLARMPHVLIAGQTGSGKSVCINCIVCSILYRSTPDEVKLIMIDPKVVELSCYNGIPHLLVPVVSDPKKASGALMWAVKEMTDRYDKFAHLGVRDIKSYNAHRPEEEPLMPQIVIIIDELADLMMVVPGEVEDSICRLAQLARAAGIHLVIATQRPSVNVITGVIKANIPSRISFTVTSQVDSRTILDQSGAEKLLGRGDMLYAPSGMGKTRVQGAWVSDDEVHAIVDFIKVRSEPSYDEDMIENIELNGKSDAERKDLLEEFDELLPDAVEMVVQAESASVSMLQRRLRVGHSRAGRLIDEMEVRGIVGPDEGSKSRKVLITREQFKAMFKE